MTPQIIVRILLFYLVGIFLRFVAQLFLNIQPIEHSEETKTQQQIIELVTNPLEKSESPC